MTYPSREIYLAGPITGLTHDEARYGWRQEFVDMMAKSAPHIHCRSPMRGKGFLKSIGVLSADTSTYPDNAMSSESGIMTRDFNDVKQTDAMVGCFLESGGRLSGGTMIEYGIAFTLQRPVITVGPQDDPNVQHAMAHRITGYHVETVEEAALIAMHLMTPGI